MGRLLEHRLSVRLLDTWRVVADAAHFGDESAFPHTVLCRLVRGRLETRFADATVAWGPGEVLHLQPGQRRRTRLAAGTRAEIEGITIACETLGGLDPLSFFDVPPRFGGAAGRELAACIRALCAADAGSSGGAPARTVRRQALCFRVLDRLVSASRLRAGMAARIRGLDRMGGVLDLIARDFRRPLTIDALARHASLSRSRFHALFRELVGQSPVAFVRRLRMEEARGLLLGTERTVAEIGAAVGWEDPFHFSRLFKAFHGVSPLVFRRRGGVAGWL